MKVVNKTRWNTQHLRAIASRVAQQHLNVAQRARLIVTVRHGRHANRRSGCSGNCYIGVMRPNIFVPSKTIDKVDFAHVVAHEIAHAKGWNHGDFSGQALFNRVGDWREIYAWAEAMPLELQQPKRKVKPGIESKIDHVQSMIARWTTKQKRAATGVKQWTRRLRYLERKKAAMRIDKSIEN